MRLLITAFEPFGGETVYAAREAVLALPEKIGVWDVEKLEVPTVFSAAGDTVVQALEQLRPDAVLCVGQAAGRAAVTPERVAINCMDARMADNAGDCPEEEPVVAGGPAAYFSTIPVKRLVGAVQAAGIPAAVSNTAGTFVCNALYYCVLHFAAQRQPRLRACFLHIPATPEQAGEGMPSMPTAEAACALEAVILAILPEEIQ